MVPDRQKVWTDGGRQNYIPPTSSGDKNNKCVSGNRPENFRLGWYTFFFKMHKIICFSQENMFH